MTFTDKFNRIDWSQIKAISFDLDDTLWDNSGVVERAEQEVYQFLLEQHPAIAEHYSLEQMVALNHKLMTSGEERYENMTNLRKHVLRTMLQASNGDLGLINPAFTVFYRWRNTITIPEKAHRLLRSLEGKYRLYAVSNGNSNLHIQQLNHYFEAHYIAGIHGRAKPSPEMLEHILERDSLAPHQLVHVGDSVITDVAASENANCPYLHIDHTDLDAWINALANKV